MKPEGKAQPHVPHWLLTDFEGDEAGPPCHASRAFATTPQVVCYRGSDSSSARASSLQPHGLCSQANHPSPLLSASSKGIYSFLTMTWHILLLRCQDSGSAPSWLHRNEYLERLNPRSNQPAKLQFARAGMDRGKVSDTRSCCDFAVINHQGSWLCAEGTGTRCSTACRGDSCTRT